MSDEVEERKARMDAHRRRQFDEARGDPPHVSKAMAKRLREWHEKVPWMCNAHDEGEHCCIDYLLDDFG